MAEKSKPSTWDRINWNPIVPALMLTIWLHSMSRRDWDWNWFRVTGTIFLSLWLVGAICDKLSGGKVVEWMNSDDDGNDFDVPPNFDEFRKSTKKTTPLIEAIERGLATDDDLAEKIGECNLRVVEDPIDAVALLSAYRGLIDSDDKRSGEIAVWFRQPGSEAIYAGFYQKGMPMVHQRLKVLLDQKADENALQDERFLLLSLLFGYGYKEAFLEIQRALADPQLNRNYSWVGTFASGNEDDPDFSNILQQLGKQLPQNFAGVAYLDCCNEMCLEHSMVPHPFSSDAGIFRLREYGSSNNSEEFSYAKSAATALPHLSHPERDSLFPIFENHPDLEVAAEASWAGAKLGREDSITRLVEMTTDWKIGERAIDYLKELDLENRIPNESLNARLRAMSRMADWLRHPHELAELPQTLEIVDHREIEWPPTEDRREVTLLKWTLADDSGIGMTGGMTTWCFFSKASLDEPILDVYARHCNWELRAKEMEGAPEHYDDLDFGRATLNAANPNENWTARA